MLPDISIIEKEDFVNYFREQIDKIQIDGHPLQFDEKDNGFFSLHFGHKNLEKKQVFYAMFNGERLPLKSLGLENIRIEDEADATAYHIPEGSLIIYDPQDLCLKPQINEISTLQIAPSILKNFSLSVPNYMQE